MVQLTAAPAVEVFASEQATLTAAAPDRTDLVNATRAQLETIAHEQQTVLAAAAALDGQVLYRLQRVYNGIAMRIPADNLAALERIDGVQAVHRLQPKRPDNAVSVPYIGVPVLWATQTAQQGLTGKGITIAVIDTGVDYLHATFGGSGAYALNDPTIIGDVPGFPGIKVVDGYDFAGDDYNADPESESYNPFPSPDPDPTDCYNHGTHVAGTAAGFGVTAPGSGGPGGVYRGPFDELTHQTRFEIGPGVAPEAQIIALKVFGCRGSSDLTELAIEWAVDPDGDGDFADRVDVINLSLGSPYGSIYEPSAVAADNAARAGVIVVASAGNAGDTYFVTGTPAAADRVISVAAANDHLVAGAARLTSADSGEPAVSIAGFSSRGPRREDWALKPDIAAPGQGIVSAISGGDGRQAVRLSGTSMAAPHVAGAAALLRQAYPTMRVDEVKALLMNRARMQSGAESPLSPTRTGAGLIDLSDILSTPALVAEESGSGRVALSFAPADVIDQHVAVESVRITNQSSEPISYTVGYVNILDAPGVNIAPERSTVTVTARGVATVSIRMSADADALRHTRDPNVANIQTYPRHWISEESGQLLFWPDGGRLQATLDTTSAGETAQAVGQIGLEFDPAGRQLTARVAGDDVFTPLNSDSLTLFHGRAETGGGALVAALDLIDGVAGAAHSGSNITGTTTLPDHVVPALAQGELYLELRRAGTQTIDMRGQIVPGQPVLHLPVYATARPAADLRAGSRMLDFTFDRLLQQDLFLEGIARTGTDAPAEVVSLVSGMELIHADGNQLPYPGTDGQADIFDHADIKYVGLLSDFGLDPNGPVAARTLYVGIVTYGEWTSPNEVEFSVLVDSDGDGEDDFRLYNADARGYEVGSTNTSDAFVAVVEDLQTGAYSQPRLLNELSPADYDTRPYGTNVMLLPVKVADLGLDNENPEFSFRIESRSNEAEEIIDETPNLTYDLSRPVFDLFSRNLDAPVMHANPDNPLTVRILPGNYIRAGQPDLLLLHYQNVGGTRDEIVNVQLTWPENVYLPYLIRR